MVTALVMLEALSAAPEPTDCLTVLASAGLMVSVSLLEKLWPLAEIVARTTILSPDAFLTALVVNVAALPLAERVATLESMEFSFSS